MAVAHELHRDSGPFSLQAMSWLLMLGWRHNGVHQDMVDGDAFMATAACNSLSNTLVDGAWISTRLCG